MPPNDAMREVLKQYGELIKARSQKVREQSASKADPDMRTGWLLWQESLRQFLYFEERMSPPNPQNFHAEWVKRISKGGARKPSTNLWIFDAKTGAKRYSVTSEAGAKIQPYFDAPPPSDPNLYIFTVIGEALETGHIRVWLTDATARELRRLLGSLDTETLSKAVIEVSQLVVERGVAQEAEREVGHPFSITLEAYQALEGAFAGVNDDHRFQLFAEQLRGA
jgi:hypothetical protein